MHARNSDISRTSQEIKNLPGDRAGPLTSRFSHTFWFGDLNYRVNAPREIALKCIADKRLEILLNNDQLYREMSHGRVFSGFWEARIDFQPTFKYTVKTDEFDSTKLRVPSWTDRILYISREGGNGTDIQSKLNANQFLGHNKSSITTLYYSSIMEYRESDHKPVVGMFRVE